jgi:hypothetical protein
MGIDPATLSRSYNVRCRDALAAAKRAAEEARYPAATHGTMNVPDTDEIRRLRAEIDKIRPKHLEPTLPWHLVKSSIYR